MKEELSELNADAMAEVLSEIAGINNTSDKIDKLSKLINKNLIAIYDAVTEINLSDEESFKCVKRLAEKQKCYEAVRKDLAASYTASAKNYKR